MRRSSSVPEQEQLSVASVVENGTEYVCFFLLRISDDHGDQTSQTRGQIRNECLMKISAASVLFGTVLKVDVLAVPF